MSTTFVGFELEISSKNKATPWDVMGLQGDACFTNVALKGETKKPACLSVVVKDRETGKDKEWPVCTLTAENPSQRVELMLNSKETKFKVSVGEVMVIGHANPGELHSEDEDSEEAEEEEEVKGAPDAKRRKVDDKNKKKNGKMTDAAKTAAEKLNQANNKKVEQEKKVAAVEKKQEKPAAEVEKESFEGSEGEEEESSEAFDEEEVAEAEKELKKEQESSESSAEIEGASSSEAEEEEGFDEEDLWRKWLLGEDEDSIRIQKWEREMEYAIDNMTVEERDALGEKEAKALAFEAAKYGESDAEYGWSDDEEEESTEDEEATS
eukprot:g10346.t1